VIGFIGKKLNSGEGKYVTSPEKRGENGKEREKEGEKAK